MSCFNFIIMKVNGADVSNLPYEDAVQLFLNAEEPIIVEVRRKCLSENNKLSFFNYDDDSPYKSPTLAVIASSSSASTSNSPLLPHFRKDNIDAVPLSPNKQKPAFASVSCQTDLSTFDDEFNEVIFMNDDDSKSGVFYRRKSKPTTIMDVMADNVDDYLKTEFDFEEITLKKSRSAENLGFTISYSTDDFLASNSGSDENDDDGGCIKEDIKLKYDKDKEYNLLNEKCAPRFKIYVSDIVPNSLADQDGRLRQGDRILQINGQNVLEKIDPDSLLTENKYSVKILVSRYAFAGDDDFLDSAVYCDDKECQLDKLVSSNEYECEQNSFSSSAKSSWMIPSKHGQALPHSSATFTGKTSSVNTCNTACQILPSIATENVCDIFSHSNIKDQLETVSKEITLLNSQISVMKQLQTETSMSSDKHHQQQQQMSSSSCSPKKVKKKTLKNYNNYPTECKASMPREPTVKGSPDAVEHIYETILEDGESDVYYCSPFEGINERRVEEWLKSIGCPNSNIHCSIKERGRTEIEPISVRLQKHNEPILDDYDNSSSAYNTGGSCSSAFLAFETKPSTGSQNDCQNYRALVTKSFSKTQSNQFSSVCRKPDFAINNKCQTDAGRTKKPSTVISDDNPSKNTDSKATAASVAAADSDGHSTLVARSSVYRMCQSKAIEEYKEKDKSEMVWKVKRRPDGSRYIVRRVIKKHSITENTENSAIHQESASAIDIDYKRQLYRVKERSRTRHHKAPTIPSKEKPHSQHWLV
ncbi:slo-interacting protein 1-like isoform X2 [Eupeodes corollae]|uniref:slo-interacting protein 1-like isoform X2 n=1 Tax=Eupeodes corollae TaxID=290404 RepID=UPI0024913B6E|nr:slo-interacting protein 1-like isoform X2 [Eupeodes corollae]